MECLLDDSVNSNLLAGCLCCHDKSVCQMSCQDRSVGPVSCHSQQKTAPSDVSNKNSPVTHNDIIMSTADSSAHGTDHLGQYYVSSLRPCLPGHVLSTQCPECEVLSMECNPSTGSGDGHPAGGSGCPVSVSVLSDDSGGHVDAGESPLKLAETTAGHCCRCGGVYGANLNRVCYPTGGGDTPPSASLSPHGQHDVTANHQHDVTANHQHDVTANHQHDVTANHQHDVTANHQHDVTANHQLDITANHQHDIRATPVTSIPIGQSHINQNKSPPSIQTWKCSVKKAPSRSHLDLQLRDIDVFKSDLRALRSSVEDSSPGLLPGPSSAGRSRTSLTATTSRRPGLRSARQSVHGAEDADGDTAMVSQGQLTPHRPLTPSRPLTPLPKELLYELHDRDHENEDLSAEVVHSLNLRNYDIKQVLGKGISSTVRRVVEKTTGQEFAVKIIDISGEKGELAQVEQTKKDTYREIRILRMCGGHPNIIELHDVFETPTFIFLVFEICKKGELFDYLTSVVSLSEKRTRIFMRQLLEAVEFFHRKNIVHRDLKPENILLDDNLNIKVSDFGFATVLEPGEELVELCGTPGYLAPEVLAHSMYENVSGYGKEVDMWACGVIMYTLLCGAPPFWNRRQMMMLRAIMNADYTFNSPEWDDISDPPKNLIQKLLLVNPQQRLTAKEALAHPFFHSTFAEEKKFDARRKFRAGVFCVVFYLRLNFSYKHPPPISMDTVRNNPYGIKALRKVIDSCAFGMYRHWVKRVDNQNRAALFEHTLRDDWKHSLMTENGIIA